MLHHLSRMLLISGYQYLLKIFTFMFINEVSHTFGFGFIFLRGEGNRISFFAHIDLKLRPGWPETHDVAPVLLSQVLRL